MYLYFITFYYIVFTFISLKEFLRALAGRQHINEMITIIITNNCIWMLPWKCCSATDSSMLMALNLGQ